MTSEYLLRPIRTEAQAAEDFAAASRVVCLRCGKPVTAGDHWECQREDAKLRMYEEMIDG